MYVLRQTSLHSSHFVGQTLVIAHRKPFLTTIGSTCLEQQMQLLDICLMQRFSRRIYQVVQTTEVVHRLDDIIHIDCLVRPANRIGLKDVTGLVMRKSATLDVIGIIGKIDLGLMINASFELHLLLLAQHGQQRHDLTFPPAAFGQLCILRDVPCFAGQECSGYLPPGTVVTDGAFCNAQSLGKFLY